MKQLLIITALATGLATTSVNAAAINDQDMGQIFKRSASASSLSGANSIQTAYLSDREMRETEGEFLAALFLIGAVSATIGYAITSGGGFNPEVSVGGGATGIVGGGVTGAVAGGVVGGGVSGLFDRNRQGASGLTRQEYSRRHLSLFQPHPHR